LLLETLANFGLFYTRQIEIERSLVKHAVFGLRDRVTLRSEIRQAQIALDMFGFVLTSTSLKQLIFSLLALLAPIVIKLALPKIY
jgi:hypothetical protein